MEDFLIDTVFESSYLRLKNIQLRYQLSKDLLKKYGLQAVSFSLNASNLITWTRWPGLDPETILKEVP